MTLIEQVDSDSDFESLLESRDIVNSPILQRYSANYHEILSNILAYKKWLIAQDKEYEQKRESVTNQIAQVRNTITELKSAEDKCILDQKVCDKKIEILMKQRSKVIQEIEVTKTRKEKISLDLVELNQDFEDMKKQKKDQWNAIKMACLVYKDNLNFHIELKQFETHDRIKVTFFRDKNPDLNNYYVEILKYKDNWQVGPIKPALEEKYLEELKGVIDVGRLLSLADIKSFLCHLKKIFSQYYLTKD